MKFQLLQSSKTKEKLFGRIIVYFFTVLFLLFTPLAGNAQGTFNTATPSNADTVSVNVYFFWGQGCPHCHKEEPFLRSLEEKYPGLKVYDFEVWGSAENRDILIKTGEALNANITGVPFTVIGNQYVVGFLNEETTGAQIEKLILNCMECEDIVGKIIGIEKVDAAPAKPDEISVESNQDTSPADSAYAENILENTILMESETLESDDTASDNAESSTDKDLKNNNGEYINLHFFFSEGCPLCTKEKEFLQSIATRDPLLNINYFNITEDEKARELYIKAIEEFKVDSAGIPFLVIGQQYFMGWKNISETGMAINEAIDCVKKNGCDDTLQRYLYSPILASEDREGDLSMPTVINLPLLGEIHTKNLSLPVLTVVIAALDGFNPCAMWALVFLIGLLLGMNDRRRMWVLGSAFIVTSALAYFLFLAAWLNLLLFLGFIFWVRLIIGLVAVGGGGYYLKEFFISKDLTCKVTGTGKRQRIFEKIKSITHESHFWVALTGIIILAFAVNLVELICSAGLPAVYTQILILSDLPTWQYYLYLCLYIFIFMLDDLIVFIIAMTTLQVTGLSTKYSHFSHLIGGFLMVIIGLLLIFKPELLMFG